MDRNSVPTQRGNPSGCGAQTCRQWRAAGQHCSMGGQSNAHGKLQPSQATPRLHSTEKQNQLASKEGAVITKYHKGTGVRIWTLATGHSLVFQDSYSSAPPEDLSSVPSTRWVFPTANQLLHSQEIQQCSGTAPMCTPPPTLIKKDSELWPADTR